MPEHDDHSHHPHSEAEHEPREHRHAEPVTADEAGSEALAEALRSSFVIIKILMIGLVVVFLGSGFFTVGSQEKAIILRFGKPLGTGEEALLGPGPHFAFPYPIDEVVKIPITQLQTVTSTVGWYATSPEMEAAGTLPPPAPTLDPTRDSYTLTGDANSIHVRATLRYRIADPLRYVFGFATAADQVRNALDNALYYASARYQVDDALTRDVTGFKETIRRRVNQLVERQRLGIVVEQSDLEAIPPRRLREDFNAVLNASVRRDQVLNEARSYANQTVSRARAEAVARTNAASSDRAQLVKQVAAEAAAFEKQLPYYERNPELFTTIWQTEALRRVMTNAQDKFFLPQAVNGQPREIRLQLTRRPRERKPLEAPEIEH